MLCADFVPASHDAALEKRECGFDGVGVNVSPHNRTYCFGDMVYRLMLVSADGVSIGRAIHR